MHTTVTLCWKQKGKKGTKTIKGEGNGCSGGGKKKTQKPTRGGRAQGSGPGSEVKHVTTGKTRHKDRQLLRPTHTPVSHTGRACVSQSDQDHEHALFPCTSHILWVSLTEGLWQPQSSKSISVIFPTASAHFMALYRLVVILTGFQAFSVLLHLLSWSVISDFTTVIGGFCILFFKSRYALFKKIMLLHT